MSILIDKSTRLLVQGITGTSGRLQTETMVCYGTNVVAGVTPGKKGQTVCGVPVFDYVSEAVEAAKPNAAISFVPPLGAKDAAIEAMNSGIKLLVLTMEGIPVQDVLEIFAYAKVRGVRVVGPGTAGVISPGRCKVGAHPAMMFAEGPVGVVSKSGALSYETGKMLTENGLGQSTVIALGGGPLWGTSHLDVVKLFNEDPGTKLIVLLGEIGGTLEIKAAEYIKTHVHKPVVAMIVGRSAPEGKSLGHVGAIVRGNLGTAQSKIAALEDAGVYVMYSMTKLVWTTQRLLGR